MTTPTKDLTPKNARQRKKAKATRSRKKSYKNLTRHNRRRRFRYRRNATKRIAIKNLPANPQGKGAKGPRD